MTQTQQKPKFIVVYGAPRTGTSLCMDIAQAAGYNPGQCHPFPKNKRRGRQEHIFGQPISDFEEHNVWKDIGRQGITCAKIIGFPEWISFLSRCFDIYILSPNRNIVDRQNSAREGMQHVYNMTMAEIMIRDAENGEWDFTKAREEVNRKKVRKQSRLLAERDEFLTTWPQDKNLHISFEDIVMRDVNQFKQIANFLDFKGDISVLMNCVDNDLVVNRSALDE